MSARTGIIHASSEEEGSEMSTRMALGECGYCGGSVPAATKKPPLHCSKCQGLYHVSCLRQDHRPTLLGDRLFVFTCALCDPMGQEQRVRPNLQWVHVIHLALYNLVMSGKVREKKGFFRWNDDICSYIQTNWSELMPHRRRTQSWHSTVAGTLSVNCPSVFQSGYKLFGEHGWWSLTKLIPPDPKFALGLGVSSKPPGKRPATSLPMDTVAPKRSRPAEAGVRGDEEKFLHSHSSKMVLSTEPAMSSSSSSCSSSSGDGEKIPSGRAQLELQPPDHDALIRFTERQETVLLEHLSRYPAVVETSPKARRLLRKLKVRALQRNYALKLFDLDEYIRKCLTNTIKYCVDDDKPYYEQIIPLIYPDCLEIGTNAGSPQEVIPSEASSSLAYGRALSKFSSIPVLSQPLARQPLRYLHYLVGGSYSHQPISSPYTARSLKPFIFRSLEILPPKAALLKDIVEHAQKRGGEVGEAYSKKSVDFCYLQQHHLHSVNALVSHFFWPVDLSECLQYPDFTVVVLYGKLVVGCGFMTPDVKVNEAYISFLVVHPEFRHCGIGKIMLYHLIQTCMGKDVTLHVSVDNPAMLLYQQFCFKAEQYCIDFYDKYYPIEHHLSKHAYFMRLRK